MKKTWIILLMAGCVTLPAIVQANSPEAKSAGASKQAASAQPKRAREHVIYYITSEPRTGSNIPMIYRRYNNRIDSASNAAVYGSTAIERTGAMDVGTDLYKLDPSISLGGRR